MKTLCIFLFYILIACSITAQDRKADSLILVDIYNKLDGQNWEGADNWLTDEPINRWSGVGLISDRVTKLNLNSFKVKGDFPVEVSKLDKLKTLEISNAELRGGIPSELQNLKELSRLMLNSCNLDGEIPNIFKDLDKLQYFGLSFNNLTGSLPDLPANLILFYIQNNKLTGTIPESWRNNGLQSIILERNNLTGTFDILSTFPNLNQIDLDRNDWSPSTFPAWLDDNLNLARFSCERCNLYGDLPSDLDFLNSEGYRGMFISDNNLSGDISLLFNNPKFGQKMYLTARRNKFSGKVPLDKAMSFFSLQLSGNYYTSLTKFNDTASVGACYLDGNNFTYESLEPVRQLIEADSIIGSKYNGQRNLLSVDTIVISTASVITIVAGDNHPDTKYKWKKGNEVLKDTTPELTLDIKDNFASGTYTCIMSNDNFPVLHLTRNNIVINVDISTKTSEIITQNVIVFPNPTNGIIKLSVDEIFDSKSYKVISIDGNIVQQGVVNSNSKIDIVSLKRGIYFLSISDDKTNYKAKITKL